MSSLHFKILDASRRNREASEIEPENPFHKDLEALNYSPLPVDPVLLEFLDVGSFDVEQFQTSLPDLTAVHAESEYLRSAWRGQRRRLPTMGSIYEHVQRGTGG